MDPKERQELLDAMSAEAKKLIDASISSALASVTGEVAGIRKDITAITAKSEETSKQVAEIATSAKSDSEKLVAIEKVHAEFKAGVDAVAGRVKAFDNLVLAYSKNPSFVMQGTDKVLAQVATLDAAGIDGAIAAFVEQEKQTKDAQAKIERNVKCQLLGLKAEASDDELQKAEAAYKENLGNKGPRRERKAAPADDAQHASASDKDDKGKQSTELVLVTEDGRKLELK